MMTRPEASQRRPSHTCTGCRRPMVSTHAHRTPGQVVHYGRGLCSGCRAGAVRRDTLVDHPRVRLPADDVLDDWDRLRRAGHSRAEAADRLGIKLESLERVLQRHRGDPRAVPGVRRRRGRAA